MKQFFLIFALALSINAYTQDADKTVTITVSGSGKTQEDAKQSALRSAIEQAFGAFISSKTEMFNNQVVADQMASVSSGNIKSFSILNESQFPDGSWGVTLKALVSLDKLTSFVEAKGITVEIKGGLFAINIKQQLLNEQGEVNAISEMVGLLHEPFQTSFDFDIKSSDPVSLDENSTNWDIPLIVTATANKNMDFCANHCINILQAISLSSDEVISYNKLNKSVYPITIKYNGVAKTFYLRKQLSYYIISTLLSQWEFYTRTFTIESGLDEYNGNTLEFITEPQARDRGSFQIAFSGGILKSYEIFTTEDIQNKGATINFLTSGQWAATFSWNDKRTIKQIEKMNGYKVKPSDIISQYKNGGFIVSEQNGNGLVAAISDLGPMQWKEAKIACDELTLNGYNDWRLPTKEELDLLYVNLRKFNIGGLGYGEYWSSNEYRPYEFSYNPINLALTQSFANYVTPNAVNNGPDSNWGRWIPRLKDSDSNVRAVRTFKKSVKK